MEKCNEKCEVFTRPNGYLRPVSNFNEGKKAEVAERKMYDPASCKDEKPSE